jgi:hypothetical protein
MKNFEKFVKISFIKNDYISYPLGTESEYKLPKYILWDSDINLILKIELGIFKQKMNKLFRNNPLNL